MKWNFSFYLSPHRNQVCGHTLELYSSVENMGIVAEGIRLRNPNSYLLEASRTYSGFKGQS
jgi:hypothetical protein